MSEPDPTLWAPAEGDDVERQRLKHRCVTTFAKHAQGQGLEIALGVLLRLATGDGMDGRPRVNSRTRRLAALDYAKLTLMASTLGERGRAGGVEPAGAPPLEAENPTVAIVRVREVEAILSSDEGLREGIQALRRSHGHAGRLRVGDQRGEVDPGPAS